MVQLKQSNLSQPNALRDREGGGRERDCLNPLNTANLSSVLTWEGVLLQHAIKTVKCVKEKKKKKKKNRQEQHTVANLMWSNLKASDHC